MSGITGRVLVVDDDASVRKSLSRLLRSAGYEVETFAAPTEFLDAERPEEDGPCCAVFDVEMPGLTGLELQERLAREPVPPPIVFITGHGDIPMGVKAMKDGAVDFLPKPVLDEELLDAVRRALDRDREARARRADLRAAREALVTLTPREHEVMRHVIAGMLNKQIARKLDIAEKTVKVHRGRVMEKTGVDSLAELVRLCQRAGIRPA
jgi:FixJ family two-component response regulator